MISIGELSRRTSVKVPTIRYYESIGLMPDPGRTQGGQRRYGDDELERLTFIRHARELGFSIDAIRELVSLAGQPGQPCARADQIATRQLDAVRARIAGLRKLEAELARIAMPCEGETAGECRVLAALADHGQCAAGH